VEVKSTLVSKNLTLNLSAKDAIEETDQYVEGYGVILWEHAFPLFFRKDANYFRLIPFIGNEGTKDVVKHLVYRYTRFSNCLT
jgi:hypothetical protein